MKISLGLILCFLIGAACRYFDVPVPAPSALLGALLVVSMSAGYNLTDRMLTRRPGSTKHLGAGPAGTTRVDAGNKGDKPHG